MPGKTQRFRKLVPALILMLPEWALAQSSQAVPPWDWTGPWYMWGGWGFWWIFPLLMMVLMFVLCAFVMRAIWGHGHSHRDDAGPAIQVLNERFAKGEISKEEFEEKRSLLVRRV